MKTIFLFFGTILFNMWVHASDTTYYAVLRSSIVCADTLYSYENFQNLNYCCQRMIKSGLNDWLVFYYAAYADLQMSFISKDEKQKDLLCNQAEEYINSALLLKPDESELYVLQALLNFARMTIDPMIRGPQLMPRANEALDMAKQKNPDNPRIYFLEGKKIMNMPDFMGGGKENALPVLEESIHLYETCISGKDIYPHWGEYSTRVLYNQCREN